MSSLNKKRVFKLLDVLDRFIKPTASNTTTTTAAAAIAIPIMETGGRPWPWERRRPAFVANATLNIICNVRIGSGVYIW